ncbi:MAG: efflux RND transporter periplasmic adaptor subunit [Bacteroidales bacterium]|nr:efflux RND transporter periplasmic adaptor subunit [Bacteroidales bacterium]
MKQNKKKKHILIIAFAVIAILIVISQNNKEKGIAVDGGYPQRSTITESIPANGKIKPVSEIKISPDVSGEIIELNVKEGDKVEAGDLLIKIKQDLYLSAVERAEASLNSVKAQYLQQKAQFSQAELAYNRNKVLHEQRAISEADYENSLSQYEIASEQLNAAQFNVKSAEAALKEARENLNKTSIYSPSSGIVSKLDV